MGMDTMTTVIMTITDTEAETADLDLRSKKSSGKITLDTTTVMIVTTRITTKSATALSQNSSSVRTLATDSRLTGTRLILQIVVVEDVELTLNEEHLRSLTT